MSLWDEIHEQPVTIDRLLRDGAAAVSAAARHIASVGPTHVVIAARGTSDNAARYAQYVWGHRNRMPVGLATPSLFTHYGTPPRLDGALVVGISQSGESPDLLAVLSAAAEQGCPTLAITNTAGSPLTTTADLTIELMAGKERSIAATKTYTAELTALAMLSEAMAGRDAGLESVPDAVATTLEAAEHIAAAAQPFAGAATAAVLGRGFNYSTAFEWALKVQETAYVLAHPYSTADFAHGPMAVVEPGFPILAVAPSGAIHGEVSSMLREVTEQLEPRLAVISDDPATLALTGHAIPIPRVPEWLSPIMAVVAAQVFTHGLAVARGLDPDAPRTISKVTRTR